jgi:hypothetical protein
MGSERSACGVLVGKPEGRRPVGRPWHRWEDNIKIDLQGIYWIDLFQDICWAPVNAVLL